MSGKREMPELQVFKTVLFHCLIIIVCPVVSFFTSKAFIFDALFGLDKASSSVYSAGVAVLVLHVALGAFIYRAYFDDQTKTSVKTD